MSDEQVAPKGLAAERRDQTTDPLAYPETPNRELIDAVSGLRRLAQVQRANGDGMSYFSTLHARCVEVVLSALDAAEAERLTQERDEACAAVTRWEAFGRTVRCADPHCSLGVAVHYCGPHDPAAKLAEAERQRDALHAENDRLQAAHVDLNLDIERLTRERGDALDTVNDIGRTLNECEARAGRLAAALTKIIPHVERWHEVQTRMPSEMDSGGWVRAGHALAEAKEALAHPAAPTEE